MQEQGGGALFEITFVLQQQQLHFTSSALARTLDITSWALHFSLLLVYHTEYPFNTPLVYQIG